MREGEGSVSLELRLPPGYKANFLAPLSVSWQSSSPLVELAAEAAGLSVAEPSFPLVLELPARFMGDATLTADLTVYYCQEELERLCLVDSVRLELPLSLDATAGDAVTLSYTVPPLP